MNAEDQFAEAAATGAQAEQGDDCTVMADHRAYGAQDRGEQTDAADPWDDPDWTVLDDRRGELPEFPTDVLRNLSCRRWLEGAAHGAGVTPAHAGFRC